MRRILVLLAALAAAPAAFAGGPNPAGFQDGVGALASDGTVRYVATASGRYTQLLSVRTRDNAVLATASLRGAWGIPRIDTSSSLSADGRTLVLAPTRIVSPSRFTIVSTRSLASHRTITLPGAYAFDALSPDGSRLYLIRYASGDDYTHYVVRAFDLKANRLVPGRIADRTQRSWVMQGMPVTRVASADGRWVYTLYANPGGYPFVHALDTVRSTARCIGVPWRGDGGAQWTMKLALHGSTLDVNLGSGKTFFSLKT
jgi:hypothetical protein